VVATPTHLHRDIVLDALKAGKHVYCEAPLAHTIADAKDIARAAQKAFKQVFQSGLQERSHPHRYWVLDKFIRSAALDRNVFVRAQWHKKGSWLKTASTPQRADELNWRLHNATSSGLMGEACIHRLDAVTWFLGGPRLGGRPSAVTGFSSIVLWNTDGRDVPDTVQCIFEYPQGPNSGVRFLCDATLCNSFDSEYEMYYGTDSAILMQPGNESRDSRAWMFKEVDAHLAGWEVYARKDSFGAESGISLAADASKQTALTDKGSAINAPPTIEPIQYSLQSFTANVGAISGAVKDYEELFGDDDTREYRANLADARKYTISQHPAAGWEEGLEATVLAIKANEAALLKQRLELKNEFFAL
jgi:predicted dehydrogenase